MRTAKLLGLSLLATATLANAALAQTVSSGGRPFSITLTGAAEVPGPGDPDGSGTGKITLNHGQGRVCFKFAVSNVDNITAAHIHRGGTTVAGPVVVGLFSGGFDNEGCTENVSRALIKEIMQFPGRFYVNIHSTAHPAGAIRAQLAK